MHENLNFSSAGTDQSAKPTNLVGSTDSLSDLAKSASPTALVSQVDSTKSAKPTAPIGLSRLPYDQPGQFTREAIKSARYNF